MPGIIAVYLWCTPWVLLWPYRGRDWETEFAQGALAFFGILVIPYCYAMWYAIPYPPLEILLAFPIACCVVVWVPMLLFALPFVIWDELEEREHDRAKAAGRFYYKNWKDYKEEEVERMRAYDEREAKRNGEDWRKEMLNVLDGGKNSK